METATPSEPEKCDVCNIYYAFDERKKCSKCSNIRPYYSKYLTVHANTHKHDTIAEYDECLICRKLVLDNLCNLLTSGNCNDYVYTFPNFIECHLIKLFKYYLANVAKISDYIIINSDAKYKIFLSQIKKYLANDQHFEFMQLLKGELDFPQIFFTSEYAEKVGKLQFASEIERRKNDIRSDSMWQYEMYYGHTHRISNRTIDWWNVDFCCYHYDKAGTPDEKSSSKIPLYYVRVLDLSNKWKRAELECCCPWDVYKKKLKYP